MIALVDYGAGNLTSVRKALHALHADVFTPAAPGELAGAEGIIVPGVGHFDATHTLDETWRAAITAAVDHGARLFGICLGMQWLFDGSDEAPQLRGLGYFGGTCTRLPTTEAAAEQVTPEGTIRHARLKVPHVGWNDLQLPRASDLLHGVTAGAHVYFTHSYAAPVVPHTAAVTTHGTAFSAAVEHGRIAGVQFHPEKSGDAGLRILRNWLQHQLIDAH